MRHTPFRRIQTCAPWALAVLLPLALGSSRVEAAARRVFLTSATGNADFDTWPQASAGLHGLAAADSICQNLAAAAGLPNASGYVAWLSDSLDDAWCRVQGLTGKRASNCGVPTPPGAGPWARVGESFAWSENLAFLASSSGGPLLPLTVDENGNPVTTVLATFTGTSRTGTGQPGAGQGYCGDWNTPGGSDSAFTGVPSRTFTSWTASVALGTGNCTTVNLRLYCLEKGAGDPLPLMPHAPAGIAFLTDSQGTGDLSTWTHAGGETGVAAGDRVCQTEAANRFLPFPETFLAWLSSPSTGNAANRLPADIAWRRIDNYLLAHNRADLTDGSLATSLNLSASGVYHPASIPLPRAWTGTTPAGGIDGSNHCSGWTTTGASGRVGAPVGTSGPWTQDSLPSCTATDPRLYCFSTRELLFWENFERGHTRRWSSQVP